MIPTRGSVDKLEITAYTDPGFSRPASDAPVSVAINPDKYSRAFKICYTDVKGAGSPGGSPVFNKMPSETVQFELVFDGTGVLPRGKSPAKDVTEQIDAFKTLVLKFDGGIHSPRFVKLAWGTLLFKCRLQSLDLTYTLFAPDGSPVRARAAVSFLGFTDEKELQARVKKSSPDLTHLVTVRAGDTLPLLCHRIYGRSDLHCQIAERNGLTDLRSLTPGDRLVFPPLDKTGAPGASAPG